jgi:hypothetical protein
MDSAITIATLMLVVDLLDLHLRCKIGVSLATLLRMVVINTSGHLGDRQDELQRV